MQFFKDRREEKKTPILEIEKIQITKLQYFSTGVLTSYFLRINKISGEGIANECNGFIDKKIDTWVDHTRHHWLSGSNR
jgi:hypothetical protein